MKEIQEALSYDDVLLVPQYSEIESRSDVDLSVKLPKIGTVLDHPLIPANMKTVVGYELAREAVIAGGLVLLHRFDPIEKQFEIFDKLEKGFGEGIKNQVGFSIGVKEHDYDNLTMLLGRSNIICVDVAHGDSKLCHDMCKYISTKFPHVLLIAGNVATKEAALRMWKTGADIIKTNVGSGSTCSTRICTGNGTPTLTSIIWAAEAKQEFLQYCKVNNISKQPMIIADGGISNGGNCVKACCFADFVMIGNLFARAEEAPGLSFEIGSTLYKEYNGSSTLKTSYVEGAEGYVRVEGKFKNILNKLLEGICSGMSYQGVDNLQSLKENPQFVKITNAGLTESKIHDLLMKDKLT